MARKLKVVMCAEGCGTKVMGALVVDGDASKAICPACRAKNVPKLTAIDLFKPPSAP